MPTPTPNACALSVGSCVQGNFVHKSRDRDSTFGEGVEIAGRTAIKKSCIGPHCRIGSGVKLTNVILMDHVVIGDKVSSPPAAAARLVLVAAAWRLAIAFGARSTN